MQTLSAVGLQGYAYGQKNYSRPPQHFILIRIKIDKVLLSQSDKSKYNIMNICTAILRNLITLNLYDFHKWLRI